MTLMMSHSFHDWTFTEDVLLGNKAISWILDNLNISVGVVLVVGQNEEVVHSRWCKFFDDMSRVVVDNTVNIFCIRWAGFVRKIVRKIYLILQKSSEVVQKFFVALTS